MWTYLMSPPTGPGARSRGIAVHWLARLADVDAALARMQGSSFAVVELCGLRALTFDEAGELLRLGRSTVHSRYIKGLSWLVAELNRDTTEAAQPAHRARGGRWRAWVSEDGDVLDPFPEMEAVMNRGAGSKSPQRGSRRSGRPLGRPKRIPAEIEARVVSLYRDGMTLGAIADALNREGVPAIGSEWRPSSFQAVLRRNGVAMRPRGRPTLWRAKLSDRPGQTSRK